MCEAQTEIHAKNFKSLDFNFWRNSPPVTPVKGVMADTKPTEPVRARASTRAESLTDVVKRRADRTFEIRQWTASKLTGT